jgi:hypothetical protein
MRTCLNRVSILGLALMVSCAPSQQKTVEDLQRQLQIAEANSKEAEKSLHEALKQRELAEVAYQEAEKAKIAELEKKNPE